MSDPGVWGEDFVFKTYRRWDTSDEKPFYTPLKFNIDICPKMTPYLKPEIHFPTIICFVSIGVIDFFWGNWNIFQSESMEKSKKDLSFLFRGESSNLGRENLSRFCPRSLRTKLVGTPVTSFGNFSQSFWSRIIDFRDDEFLFQVLWKKKSISEAGLCYEYSGRENVGQSWHPAVLEIKRKAGASQKTQ